MTFNDLIKRIESYPKGFKFTLYYNQMKEKTKTDAIKLMRIAVNKGLVESVEIGAGWNADGNFNLCQNETFKRL